MGRKRKRILMRLKNKFAIITGGAKGLGRAFALKMAEEGAGVLVVTRKDLDNLKETVRQVEAMGGKAAWFQGDVTKPEDMEAMAKTAMDRFGKIDILINNAAVYDGIKRKSFIEIDVKEWDLVMGVNVKGAFLATQAVFPYMKEQNSGKILNLSSEVFFTGSHGFAHYVASKGGIIGLTRALAIELGPHNICINCLAPGFTDTEASRGITDVKKYDTSKTPINRLEKPEDLTGAAAFFASGDSDFITGQTMLVDGGRAMH